MKERGVASKSQLFWNSACLAFDVKVWRLRDMCRRCCTSVDDSNECWVTRASRAQSLRELRNQDTAPVRRLQKTKEESWRRKTNDKREQTFTTRSVDDNNNYIKADDSGACEEHITLSWLSLHLDFQPGCPDAPKPNIDNKKSQPQQTDILVSSSFRLRRHCLDGCLQVHDENNFPATNRRSSALTRA